MTWGEIRGQLATLSLLRRGWDGGTAYGPTSVAIVEAAALLGYLESWVVPPSSVVPTVEGGLQFEWSGQRWAEARIGPAGTLSWISEDQEDNQADALAIHLGAA